MKISILPEINLDNINRIQSNLKTKIPHILDGIGLFVTASVIKNFESQGRPEKWTSLSPETLKRKKGNMILQEDGALKGSIIHEVEGNAVFVSPSGPASVYARIHDRGGMAGKDLEVEIPQRRYLFLQDEDREYINNFVREEISS